MAEYPEGEPVLQAVSPIGGDYTKDIVIAVSGRAYPDSDPSIETLCEVSWSGTNQRVAASGDRIETVRDVVWSGPLVAYDRRPIAQADSLTLQGLCILPAGTFPKPSADKKEAMVTLIWRRNATQQVIASRDSRRFLLYGPFYPASSTVQVVANEADGEVRVFRDQTLRVTLADADGNNRVGGEDSDIFSLSWHDGPSSEPLVRFAVFFFFFIEILLLVLRHSHDIHTHTHTVWHQGRRRQGLQVQRVPTQARQPDVRLLRADAVVRLCRQVQG
jgi:hypothetical protein